MRNRYSFRQLIAVIVLFLGQYSLAFTQGISPGFDTLAWDLSNARIVYHLDRESLMGSAYNNDLVFENGIIEVDIATTAGMRSYPALLFRVQDPSHFERVYLRPHRSPFYDDALQYAPTFNGVDSWQLYSGPGKTSGLEILPGKWNRLTIKISDDRAQVFWNEGPYPVMTIDQLAHGTSSGIIGLTTGMDGSAYFSNFHVILTDSLTFPPSHLPEAMQGIIKEWELSTPYPVLGADFMSYPAMDLQSGLQWQEVQSDNKGFVDISKYHPRMTRAGDVILAKTNLTVAKDTLLRMGFGYSDYITVYLNGEPVFSGNSAYRSRDPSFLGIMGYFDNLFLPLRKGDNEILLQVGESMGGWGFCLRKEDEKYLSPAVKKLWEAKSGFSMPECVVYDPENDVCYISNYFNEGKEYIARVSVEGEMISREWVTGLAMPTGMALKDDLLYAVARSGLHVIDIKKGEIIKIISLEGMLGPNDVAIDNEGNIYVSDMRQNAIFKLQDGAPEPWLENMNGPNGLFADQGYLLVGENEKLLKVSLADRSVDTLVFFERGANIDGIQKTGEGTYLASDYRGRLYRISEKEGKSIILDTFTPAMDIADFAYAPDKHMIIIPTFRNNTVAAYLLKKE